MRDPSSRNIWRSRRIGGLIGIPQECFSQILHVYGKIFGGAVTPYL
jgi:hypothetical protein